MTGNRRPHASSAILGHETRLDSAHCADCAMRGGGAYSCPCVLRRLRHAHMRQKSIFLSLLYISRTHNGFPLPDARAWRNRRRPGEASNYFTEAPQ